MKNKTFETIWNLASPYLKKGVMKNFVLHTRGVIEAMELLLREEEGDESILIPAAILHDVGWSKVPVALQKSKESGDRKKALELHLEFSAPIIREILEKVSYDQEKIDQIVEIVKAHKFQEPEDSEKQLLIDADTLSDAFKKQFYSDVQSYETTPQGLYNFRKENKFYTSAAKKLFDKEIEERRKEFQK